MLNLIIGLTITLVVLELRNKYKWIDDNLPFILMFVIFIFGTMAFVSEGDFYDNVNVQTFNVGKIDTADGTLVSDYISRDDRGYYYFIKVTDDNKWVTTKVPSDAVMFVTESPEIEKPILKISKMGYQANKWTFSVGYERYIYQFELPLTKELAMAGE